MSSFALVEDSVLSIHLLSRAIQAGAGVQLQTKESGIKVNACFHYQMIENQVFFICILEPESEALLLKEKSIFWGVSEVLFSTTSKGVKLHFKAKFDTMKDGYFGFRFPKELYYDQKRMAKRVALRKEGLMYVKFPLATDLKIYCVSDISLGGVGIQVSPLEAMDFSHGDQHPNVQLIFLKDVVSVDVIVKNKRPSLYHKERLLIGFEFVKIAPDFKNVLSEFIDSQS